MFLNPHFLKLLDLSPSKLRRLVDSALTLKKLRNCAQERPGLRMRDVALLFQESSQSARWSAEVGCAQAGLRGHFLGEAYTGFQDSDSAACSSRRLGRLFEGLLLYGLRQESVEEVARLSGVPVFNLGNEQFQPLAVLADFLTIAEASSRPFSDISVTYLGDGTRSLAQSFMVGAAKLGIDLRFCCPKGRQPEETLTETCLALAAETGGQIRLYNEADQAVKGADFLYSHAWLEPGQKLTKKLLKEFLPYRVTGELLTQTGNTRCQLLHHLPFHLLEDSEASRELSQKFELHGLEVSGELADGSACLAYDQVENHLHACKAVLTSLFF